MDVPRVPGYDVLGRIGVGSSAQVWRARRQADDLRVALKVLPTQPSHVTAALREAGLLAAVRHQHVIRLYDVLPVPGTTGRPAGIALAMELADGGSLAEVLGARSHLTPGELVTVCAPLAGALAELHRAGVVHGDLAPGNVLFHADGMPLLADLGVARIAGERRSETYGTDGMVAPEVLEGFPPSAESDVYGLGALAWTCLVGEPPGWVGTRSELGELRPELPEALVAVVTSCLSAEPSERPEAEEVAVALFAAARPEPVELAPGADPAAGLTQRIRVDGARPQDEDTPGGDPPGEPGSHGRPAQSRSRDAGALLARARGRTHPRALHRSAPATSRGLRHRLSWAVGGAGVLLVAAVLLVPGVRTVLPGGGPEDRADPQAPATREIAGSTVDSGPALPAVDPAGAATGDGAAGDGAGEGVAGEGPVQDVSEEVVDDEAVDPEAVDEEAVDEEPRAGAGGEEPAVLDPVEQPGTSAQHLLDARASAWRSGDPADLARAHAAGSPAYEQEADALDRAEEQEVVYRGLEFTVTRASVLEAEHDRVRVELDVQRSAYETVTPQGTVRHPSSTDLVEIELRRSAGDWRIWGWG